MLLDSAHVQEMDAEWQTKTGGKASVPSEPLYRTRDTEESLRYLAPVQLIRPLIWNRVPRSDFETRGISWDQLLRSCRSRTKGKKKSFFVPAMENMTSS